MKKMKFLGYMLLASIALVSCGKKNTTTTDTQTTTQTVVEKQYTYDEFIKASCGENAVVYAAGDDNPYGIDLTKYGDNISAVFYQPKEIQDPYENITKEDFYKQYTKAINYDDAKKRTQHGIISGENKMDSNYIPSLGVKEKDTYLFSNTGTYILNIDGSYLGYIINTKEYARAVFYGAGYVSLNDVSAYLLAFGSLPGNMNYGTASSMQKSAMDKWGDYARVNNASFSGDVEKYPYEPLLPKIMGVGRIYYTETDFGTLGGYDYTFMHKTTTQNPYVYTDPSTKLVTIKRGICRFVFVSDPNVTKIEERHVFYTYNHYNDFQEYLNYDNGFGERFGFETAGNLPCSNRNDYEEGMNAPTAYVEVKQVPFSEIK